MHRTEGCLSLFVTKPIKHPPGVIGLVGSAPNDDIVKGREGQYRVRLMDNYRGSDCAYPGVEILPDGTFVTTTYGHWTQGEKPYIVSVRFKLEELDAIAKKKEK